MDLAKFLGPLLDRPRIAEVRAVLDIYGRAPGGLLANGLAFTALFAVVPTALVTLGVAGLLVADPTVQAQLAATLGTFVPPLRDLFDEALTALSEGAALTSAVGLVGLIWTVSQFYVTLDIAFSRIFTEHPERDLFRRTTRGFVWVAGLVGVVVALIVGGSLATAAEALLPTSRFALVSIGRVVSSIPVVTLIAIIVVLLVYRVLPSRVPSWRSISLPAAVAGIAIVLLTQGFLFVAPRIVSAAALAGSLATAFIALAWLSLTFQVLLFCAAWGRVRDDARHVVGFGRSALGSSAAAAEPGARGE